MDGHRWFSCRRKSLSAGSAAPDSRHPTPVIVGPTGVGKTAVAVALAARRPITVISADARQLYRGLDIGTAKPDPQTLARVPHKGLDLLEPGERYSAGRFARDAAEGVAPRDGVAGAWGGRGSTFARSPTACSTSRCWIPNGASGCASGPATWRRGSWCVGRGGSMPAFPVVAGSAPRAPLRLPC